MRLHLDSSVIPSTIIRSILLLKSKLVSGKKGNTGNDFFGAEINFGAKRIHGRTQTVGTYICTLVENAITQELAAPHA
jgi:hypothetical protein